MAKFSGVIGYQDEIEEAPGVCKTSYVEKPKRGDILRKDHRWNNVSFSTISNDTISDKIQIGADDLCTRLVRQNKIRYVKYEGDNTRYAVTNASVDRPHIVLTIGGIFNG